MAAFVREMLRAQSLTVVDQVVHVETRDAALSALTQRPDHWDVVIIDLHLPDGEGITVVEGIAMHARDAALIVLTADQDADIGVEALRRGAAEFLPKSELSVTTLARCLRFAIERRRFHAQLLALADHDELTGLANRRALIAFYTRQMAAATRAGHRLVVAVFDVNNFKQINDTMGHGSGDDVLMRVAEGLRNTVRTQDLVARLGGDEFAVCATLASSVDLRYLRRRLTVFASNADPTRAIDVQLALGIAEAQADEPLESVLARADVAMYERKRKQHDALHAIGISSTPVISA